jgi:hypothetical protein
MKTYYNGPRQGMMYGGGVNMRKPMMDGGKVTKKKMNMGGLAQENRKRTTAQSSMNPMGDMTEQKKFSMGMMYGGQAKLDKNKDGKISGKDFKMMRKK